MAQTPSEFATDGEIISNRRGPVKLKELTPWVCSDEDPEVQGLESITLGNEGGWDVGEMYRKNKVRFGVPSSFDNKMNGYTTEVDTSNAEFKKQEKQARKVVREIQNGISSGHRSCEERNDEGKEAETARSRNNGVVYGEHSAPSKRRDANNRTKNFPPSRRGDRFSGNNQPASAGHQNRWGAEKVRTKVGESDSGRRSNHHASPKISNGGVESFSVIKFGKEMSQDWRRKPHDSKIAPAPKREEPSKVKDGKMVVHHGKLADDKHLKDVAPLPEDNGKIEEPTSITQSDKSLVNGKVYPSPGGTASPSPESSNKSYDSAFSSSSSPNGNIMAANVNVNHESAQITPTTPGTQMPKDVRSSSCERVYMNNKFQFNPNAKEFSPEMPGNSPPTRIASEQLPAYAQHYVSSPVTHSSFEPMKPIAVQSYHHVPIPSVDQHNMCPSYTPTLTSYSVTSPSGSPGNWGYNREYTRENSPLPEFPQNSGKPNHTFWWMPIPAINNNSSVPQGPYPAIRVVLRGPPNVPTFHSDQVNPTYPQPIHCISPDNNRTIHPSSNYDGHRPYVTVPATNVLRTACPLPNFYGHDQAKHGGYFQNPCNSSAHRILPGYEGQFNFPSEVTQVSYHQTKEDYSNTARYSNVAHAQMDIPWTAPQNQIHYRGY